MTEPKLHKSVCDQDGVIYLLALLLKKRGFKSHK
jgi:hypothetical protein